MGHDDCIFCRLSRGELPCAKSYEDDDCLAFDDLHPQAPVHLLVIPKRHLATLDDAAPEDAALLGKLMIVGARLMRERGIATSGYRQIVNCRGDGGQVVMHLHLHFMGGSRLGRMG